MTPQDPLAQLHPLRQPEAIGLWPLAPGWWLLAAVFVLLLCIATYWLLQHRAASAYRRQALAQLHSLYDNFQADGDAAALARNTNGLLKRVAMITFPERALAPCHGAAWLAFLRDSGAGKAAFSQDFTGLLYQDAGSELDAAALYRDARAWIKHHRGPT